MKMFHAFWCLKSHHLKQRQESVEGVVKIDVRLNPAVSSFKACGLIGHHSSVIFDTVRINALVEFPAKKVDTHDTKDKPKHHTDEENIGDTRNGVKQRTYHHLQRSENISYNVNQEAKTIISGTVGSSASFCPK